MSKINNKRIENKSLDILKTYVSIHACLINVCPTLSTMPCVCVYAIEKQVTASQKMHLTQMWTYAKVLRNRFKAKSLFFCSNPLDRFSHSLDFHNDWDWLTMFIRFSLFLVELWHSELYCQCTVACFEVPPNENNGNKFLKSKEKNVDAKWPKNSEQWICLRIF